MLGLGGSPNKGRVDVAELVCDTEATEMLSGVWVLKPAATGLGYTGIAHE